MISQSLAVTETDMTGRASAELYLASIVNSKDKIMRNSVGRHACISEKMLKTSDFELVDVVGKLLMCAVSPSCVRARGTMNVRKD